MALLTSSCSDLQGLVVTPQELSQSQGTTEPDLKGHAALFHLHEGQEQLRSQKSDGPWGALMTGGDTRELSGVLVVKICFFNLGIGYKVGFSL